MTSCGFRNRISTPLGLVKVRADNLAIHPVAQRELLPAKLKKLIADMDLDAIGVLHAVEYPISGKSKVWIIDGQHRVRALMELGFGEWLVEVKIHLDATDDARACALFLKLNDRADGTRSQWGPLNPAPLGLRVHARALLNQRKSSRARI